MNEESLPCIEPCNMTYSCAQKFCIKCSHCLSYKYYDDSEKGRIVTRVTCDLNCDCKNFKYDKNR